MKPISSAILSLLAAALAAPGLCIAQTWPSKPVKVISTIPLGGSGDVAIRLATSKMSANLGQALVVETNGAAGGMVAARLVVAAPPDGYTLFHSSNGALVASMLTSKNPGYDSMKDFAPISLVAASPSFIAVSASVPVNTVQQLVDYAKKNPGKLSYGSNGVGSFFHLTGETFKMAAGIDVLHIPYTGGNVSVPLNDLLSGRIDLFFPSMTLAGPHLSTGKMKLLAVLGEQRLKRAPDVPTIKEAFPAYTPMPSWFGLVAPAATPSALTHRIQSEIAKALADPEVTQRLNDLGMNAVGSTPDQFAATMKSTLEITRQAVTSLKIAPQ